MTKRREHVYREHSTSCIRLQILYTRLDLEVREEVVARLRKTARFNANSPYFAIGLSI